MVASVLLAPTVSAAAQGQYSHGDPSPLEQQMLEFINRSRLNPTQEGIRLDAVNTTYSAAARRQAPSFFANLRGEFATYPAVAPLAFHPTLIQAAREHSQDMIANRYFSHANLAGQDPTARGTALGYTTGLGENLDGAGAVTGDEVARVHYDLMVDFNNVDTAHPLGHRLNVLNSSYSEIGVGIAGAYSGGMVTQDFSAPTRSYILGVVYLDTNGNGTYDAGEGLSGVTVTPDSGNYFAVTSTSGGFAIPVDPVQTVTDTVNVPFPVQTSVWASVQPYDAAYRQQQLAAAPMMSVNLTWSGGPLASPIVTSVNIKRPVLRNFRLTGTDGWFYNQSMVTTRNTKADLVPAQSSLVPPTPSVPLPDFSGDAKGDVLFQNGSGQIFAWFLDGTGSSVDATTGAGRVAAKFFYGGGLADWRIVGRADLNSDGKADLLFQNGAGQLYVWFLDGTGNAVDAPSGSGRIGGKFLYSSGLGDWKVVACADLNKDGYNDLLFQNGAGQLYTWFLDGTGNAMDASSGSGRISANFLYSGALGDWRVAAYADVNNDGNNDLIFQNAVGQICVWFLDGTGNTVNTATGAGRRGANMLYASGLGDWRLMASADINNDGKADLIFQNGLGQIYMWLMDGSGASLNFSTGTGLKPGSRYLYGGGLGDWRIR